MTGITFGGFPFSKTGKWNNEISDAAIMGVESDLGASTNGGGQGEAPLHIRLATPVIDSLRGKFVDVGDVIPIHRSFDRLNEDIQAAMVDLLPNTNFPIVLGGDDSINLPIVRTMAVFIPDLTLVHADAHHDASLPLDNERDHATWVRDIAELNVLAEIQQYGVRRLDWNKNPMPHDISWHEKWQPRMITMTNNVWLAIDLDVLDPAFAPGVGVPTPFGWTPTMLLDFVHAVFRDKNVVGMSITEMVPAHDINEATARIAGFLVNEVLALITTT